MYKTTLNRNIFFLGRIEDKSVFDLGKQLNEIYKKNSGNWISLFIGSFGGVVNTTFGLYEYITSILKPKLQTISLGVTSSMAPVLFVAGEHRVVGRYTRFSFHHLGRTIDSSSSRISAAEFQSEGKEFAELERIYIEILCDRCGGKLSSRLLRQWIHDEITIGAEECVKHGFAHEILKK